MLRSACSAQRSLRGVGFPKHIQRAPACRPRVTVKPCAAASRELSTASKPEPLTILVLGGTGFVGSAFIKAASAKGHKVISLSRRGRPPADAPQTDENVEWVQGDATEYKAIEDVVSSHPDINACFHCIGLLLDEASGLSNLNKMASGSGSVPSANSSYDATTRQTAQNAIQALGRAALVSEAARSGSGRKLPFVFTSAAEAGWTFKSPVDFLERYLVAKRAVEDSLMNTEYLRGTILRPSLIWTWERPQALPSVIPFYVASKIGIPFIDEPVLLETLVGAALAALQDENESGVKRFMDMERLAGTNK